MEVLLYGITKGNPGAIQVASEATALGHGYLCLLLAWGSPPHNKTGSDLWVEYKKAGKDIGRLLESAHKDLPDFPYKSPQSVFHPARA